METKIPDTSSLPEVISYSRLMEFASCRYRWDLKYRRGISRRVTDRAPNLGSAVHTGMAAAMLGEDYEAKIGEWKKKELEDKLLGVDNAEIQTVNDQIAEQFDEIEQTAIVIVRRTLQYFNPLKWEVYYYLGEPMVEVNMTCKIKRWHGFQGFIDLIAVEKETGHVWIIDYKVRKSLQPEFDEEVNLQMAAYQYMALKNGISTVGTITLQILAKPNSIPKVNKDGSMSRAKIATDWDSYKTALIENGLDPEDYEEDMKPKLDTEYIRESRAYRSTLEVKKTWNEVIQAMALDMSQVKPQHIYRKLQSFNCKTCWAREFCLEELRGQDVDHLLENEYQLKGADNNVSSEK